MTNTACEVIEYLKTKGNTFVGLDTETQVENFKKDEIRDHKLVLLQVGDKDTQFLLSNYKEMKQVLHFLLENQMVCVGHNIKYDYEIIYLNLGIRLRHVRDTMLGEQILNMNREAPKGFYSLESTFTRYFKYNPYAAESGGVDKSTRLTFRFGEELTSDQIRYAKLDIEATCILFEAVEEKLGALDLLRVFNLECRFVRTLSEMELSGMPIDVDRWIDLDALISDKVKKSYADFCAKYSNEIEKLNLPKFNINSPVQVGPLLVEAGVPLNEVKGKVSVSKTALSPFIATHPIVKDYLAYKTLKKIKGTYGISFLKYVSKYTGRVHSSYIQILNTGRTSSSGPNCQNIIKKSKAFPEGDEWRKAFRSAEGYTLIVADFANQEARILADKSGEDAMQAILNADGDLHSLTASKVFGVEVSKTVNPHLREIGKTLNFSIFYGAGVNKISDALKETKKEAAKILHRFFRGYPKLKDYFDSREKELYKKGYLICDNLGRKALFNLDNVTPKLAAEYRRKSQNYPM